MEGVVLQSTGSWYIVKTEDGNVLNCRLPGRFKIGEKKDTNPIAVGDKVIITQDEATTDFVIDEILDRKNYIIRQSPRQKHLRHIIASNIDQAFIVATISQPRTSLGFIDRFLVIAEMYHIPATIIINKVDLLKQKEMDKLEELIKVYTEIGYRVIPSSTQTFKGIDRIKESMQNKTNLIMGHSGVGKSSLLNVLNPSLQLKTASISNKWEKGTHTTTFATMYELGINTYVIDTPGIKELFVIEMEPEELSGYFPEMRKVSDLCQFNNCSHENEQQCGVKEAFSKGKISESRYMSYFNILDNIRSQDYWKRM
ncbi:MAG: ribosome small subunit-dependent GTPase A [Chitinophagales bacterium]|nr:ribosome small subunit-dependent GTPase A [Chitinophagales bacterium]